MHQSTNAASTITLQEAQRIAAEFEGEKAQRPAFIHYPRPAITPAESAFAVQRRFGADRMQAHGIHLHTDDGTPNWSQVQVYRDAREDAAELRVTIGIHTRATVTARMQPDELRALAASLIDAAADLEQNPASLAPPMSTLRERHHVMAAAARQEAQA